MSTRSTDREHIGQVLRAVSTIAATKRFNQLIDSRVGWKSTKSWARWIGRAVEPSIMKRDRLTEIVDALEPEINAASIRNAYFAEKFLEEIVLICNSDIEDAFISFVIGEAFTIFGPLLAPLSQGASTVVSGVISAAKKGAQIGISKGASKAFSSSKLSAEMSAADRTSATGVEEPIDWDNLPTRGRSSAVTSRSNDLAIDSMSYRPGDLATEAEQQHGKVNPVQYAVCLFDYLNERKSYTKEEALVVKEFGGADKVWFLYDTLDVGGYYP